MSPTRSAEIEAVARRVVLAWQARDLETMSNLFSRDPHLRVLGFDASEWWVGPAEFLGIFSAQSSEWPDWDIEVEAAEAFEEGPFGWATLFSTLRTPETNTPMRHTACLRLEAGAWRVIHWQNSLPVPNQQVFGVELTTTLDDLVAAVLDDGTPLTSAAGSQGTMTLVFTDIVDSTALAESVGDTAWAQLVSSHESTIRHITASQNGTVVKFLGDGSMLAFESARAAVQTAVEIQQSSDGTPFRVRIGIHTGEVIRTADDLLGLTVNKAARVAAAAQPGETMASSTTRDLVGSMEGIRMEEPRTLALKGLSGNHQVVSVRWD